MQPSISNRVEDLSSCVGLYTLTCSHHDQAYNSDDDAEKKTLWSAEDVKDLGDGEIGHASDDTAYYAHGWCQRVRGECGGDVRIQRSGCAGEETFDEVNEPHQDVSDDQGLG